MLVWTYWGVYAGTNEQSTVLYGIWKTSEYLLTVSPNISKGNMQTKYLTKHYHS